jgi:hypothetical protein
MVEGGEDSGSSWLTLNNFLIVLFVVICIIVLFVVFPRILGALRYG